MEGARRIDHRDARDLAAWVAVRNAAYPWLLTSTDEAFIRGERTRLHVLVLVEQGGAPVGAARAVVDADSPEDLNGGVYVVSEARRTGIGSWLLDAICEIGRGWGATQVEGMVCEAEPGGPAFASHHGFEVANRLKWVSLDLAGVERPAVEPPPGVRIVRLSEIPGREHALHAIACEAIPDIPANPPFPPPSYEEWHADEIALPWVAPELWAVALAGDEVVGYASLVERPASPGVGLHELTAVARAWRGRGIARALKRATIGYGIGAGLERLTTSNDEENAPMRAINASLGYRPEPDRLWMRATMPPAP